MNRVQYKESYTKGDHTDDNTRKMEVDVYVAVEIHLTIHNGLQVEKISICAAHK